MSYTFRSDRSKPCRRAVSGSGTNRSCASITYRRGFSTAKSASFGASPLVGGSTRRDRESDPISGR